MKPRGSSIASPTSLQSPPSAPSKPDRIFVPSALGTAKRVMVILFWVVANASAAFGFGMFVLLCLSGLTADQLGGQLAYLVAPHSPTSATHALADMWAVPSSATCLGLFGLLCAFRCAAFIGAKSADKGVLRG